ncbi:HNH endonuclease signature motif containing protein [Streptomyces sp. NPDC093589]|uniref:HNH endonuclease signature motif containing protein n=1 Tax=Streptomyces sp. NPDC093589 TaxID=3366043 RepID=UPI00380B1C5E
MPGRARYTRELLTRTAAVSTGLVDMLRRLGTPVGSGSCRYLRTRLQHYGISTVHFADEPLPPRQRRSYTEAVLAKAAPQCRSIREMLDHLAVPPYDSAYAHLRKKLDQYGIDTTHFTTREGRSVLLGRDELAQAVAVSESVAGVVRCLARTGTRTSHRPVKRSIDAYGLSTAHFTGPGHRRGRPSPTRKAAADILQRLPPGARRTKTALLRRALDDREMPHRCRACGIGETWQGKRLVLEIDHINGDRLDNRITNLRYLCPSCHSQTRTFAGRSPRTAVQAVAGKGPVE